MGTRNLVIVVHKGSMVIVQYGQWDGYPQGQGTRVLHFLHGPGNIERLAAGLQHIYYPGKEELDEIDARAEKANREECAKEPRVLIPKNVMLEICPSLSRDTAAGILDLVAQATEEKKVPISKDLEFIADTLMCEFVWVVDLDDRVFEGYGGYENREGAQSQRFNDIKGFEEVVPRLICKFGFDDLPGDIDDVDKDIDEDLEESEEPGEE